MDLAKILETLAMAGANLPAYKALLDQVLQVVEGTDKLTLEQAIAESDAAHRDAQSL